MSSDQNSKSIFNKMFDCVNSGIAWTVSPTKSACPPRKNKKAQDKSASDESLDDTNPDGSGFRRKSLYIPPSQICPSSEKTGCCVIKMQDPCAPCCCDPKPKYPPCPPKSFPTEPREPVCGCDLCEKDGANEKCCDRNKAFRGITLDPRYFEKA